MTEEQPTYRNGAGLHKVKQKNMFEEKTYVFVMANCLIYVQGKKMAETSC